MSLTALTALSPLDGRYSRQTAALADIFSELGLMRYRLKMEIAWLKALANHPGIPELPPLDERGERALDAVLAGFDETGGITVKSIEATTNHDVKAIEYYLRKQLAAEPSLTQALEFVHFALTSEDVNNVAYACMTLDGRDQVLIPAMARIVAQCDELAEQEAATPMLARTHGQPASPTTVGKEMRVFTTRLMRLLEAVKAVTLSGKINGAVGNYNAHYIAYPEIDWPLFAGSVLADLGLAQNPHTTQIEPHDGLATLCHALMRFNTALIDLCRDVWGYISLAYFRQRTKAGEVGSSTMPHKVNPIDFENAEGNLGVANALLGHLAGKLPISRFQRDLSDSTVLRNVGTAMGYALLGYTACSRGLAKLEVDRDRLNADLAAHDEVLTEAVQTVMRRYGLKGGYEQMKELSRGRRLTRADLHAFIRGLALPDEAKERLLALTPLNYVGNAPQQGLEPSGT
ncbi:MAG: adenylosuccinate lyase [Gammaproteobacteria bacterium]|nr:adenylosuccinate lyase [Gammaproteobacteria bacterium]